MKTRLSLLLGFLSYVICGFLVTQFLVQWKVETVIQGDTLNAIGLTFYYAFLGYAIYFSAINVTSIGGWLISKRLKNSEAISTFKVTTMLTVGFTLLFFLYYFM